MHHDNSNDYNKYNTINDTTNGNTDVMETEQACDRTMIDLIKENMSKERKWNNDMQIVLKEEIEFLRYELVVKNTLIERLMDELHENIGKGTLRV